MRTPALIAAVVSLVGCTDPFEEYAKNAAALDAKWVPKIEALRPKLEAARQAALQKPPLRKPEQWIGPPLVPTNCADAFGRISNDNTAVMVANAGLCESELDRTAEPFLFSGLNELCAKLRFGAGPHPDRERTRKEDLPNILRGRAENLERAASTRYAMFVETRAFTRPVAGGTSFRGGVWTGAFRVFDLQNGAYLGGYELTSRSDSSVGVATGDSRRAAVARDFAENSQRDLARALAEFGAGGCPAGRAFRVGDTLER